ncbi:MAG: antitermination protein NusG [Gammaproteobacteria bacterium]|nr:antitermination protein NusG [Gammaproteobacteria bacterium]
MAGLDFLFRWIHLLGGITWIGLLYYFNFVQTEYFKEAEPAHRAGAIQKLVPRALWWFRWGAMLTFLTGVALLSARHSGLTYAITVGSVLGTIMFLNVWLIIWPNQKIVIASANGVAEGNEPLPEAAGAAPKAALASRTNTLFSAPMLFMMFASGHLSLGENTMLAAASATSLGIVLLVIILLELNAIFGKQGPLTSVGGVIHCSLGLTALLYIVMALV